MNRSSTTILNLGGALAAGSVMAALVVMTSNAADAAPVQSADFSVAASELSAAAEKIRGPRVPCFTDETTGEAGQACVWDALHRGNGAGRSFLITSDGRHVFVSHARAHALTFGARS